MFVIGQGVAILLTIYLETLEVSIGIKMCGQILFKLTNSVTSAHFWPFLKRENCDALVIGPQRLLSFAIVPIILLALLPVNVKWTTKDQNAVSIAVTDRSGVVLECLEEGRKARLRFEVRICRRRSGWVDFCEEARSELHTVTFEELTESYRVVVDRFGDKQEPVSREVPLRAEAINLVTTLDNLPLKFLISDEPDIIQHPDAYLQVRTAFTCRGNSSRPFAHISRIITFGLLNTVEDRGDWSDFSLHQGMAPLQD